MRADAGKPAKNTPLTPFTLPVDEFAFLLFFIFSSSMPLTWQKTENGIKQLGGQWQCYRGYLYLFYFGLSFKLKCNWTMDGELFTHMHMKKQSERVMFSWLIIRAGSVKHLWILHHHFNFTLFPRIPFPIDNKSQISAAGMGVLSHVKGINKMKWNVT